MRRLRLAFLFVVLLLLSQAPCADAKKKKKKKKKRRRKKMQTKAREEVEGEEAPPVVAAAVEEKEKEEEAEAIKAAAEANTFLASGTVLGLANEPVVLAPPKTRLGKKKKKKKEKNNKKRGEREEQEEQDVDGGEEYLISVVATPIGGAGGALEGTVDPETGEFAIDGLASGTEYAVGLASRSPLSAGWGFTLSPASIRVVDGSSTILSFVAVPSPAKAAAGATLSGVLSADESVAEKVTISLFRQQDAGATKKVLQRTTIKEGHRAARYFAFTDVSDGKYTVTVSLQSNELDSKEVTVSTGDDAAAAPLVRLSAAPWRRPGVDNDGSTVDDINAAGPFFSILFASVVFCGVMFPGTAFSMMLPILTLVATLSGSAQASMARSNVAVFRKAADHAAPTAKDAGGDEGYDMTGGLTMRRKKFKSNRGN
jgi:hypothetical protein